MSLVANSSELSKSIMDAALAGKGFDEVRTKARTALTRLGFPVNKSEEYRFTPIMRSLEKAFTNWPQNLPDTRLTDIATYLPAGRDLHVAVLINGRYSPSLSVADGANFDIGDLNASSSDSTVLFQQADFLKDPFVALNTAAWTAGIAIRVADGIQADRPVLVLNILDASSDPVASHTRLSVHVGKGSSLQVVSQNLCLGTQASFATVIEEILVEERAQFDYCRIQNDKQELSFNQTDIRQLSESHVNTFTLTLDGKLIRNNLNIAIDGERVESHFHGLYLLNGETIADNHTVVDHRKPNSFSNELYKGVMDGKSKGVFNGKIYVRPDAQKTNAFQSNRNILLSENATINTKPQLEIWADDVKCSHGCTTGQLDEEALFYLRSRGIPKDQAQAMLLYAFAAETFSFIRNESLKAQVNNLVAQRLNKEM
jgi:Fe-S cluster assembly protein SufD